MATIGRLPVGCQPGGESHRVGFRDADVEEPVGKGFLEQVEAGARRPWLP